MSHINLTLTIYLCNNYIMYFNWSGRYQINGENDS